MNEIAALFASPGTPALALAVGFALAAVLNAKPQDESLRGIQVFAAFMLLILLLSIVSRAHTT